MDTARLPIRIRLALWYVTSFFLVLVLFAAGTFYAMRAGIQKDCDRNLAARLADIESFLIEQSIPDTDHLKHELQEHASLRPGGELLQITDGNGRWLNPRVGTKTNPTYLDGMQWSDQISTIRRVMTPGSETTSEFVHPTGLPAFLGTEAVFIPAPAIARAAKGTDILDLDCLRGKVIVGYIYGGIRAFPYRFPYDRTARPYNSGAVPSKPNDLILKVYVQVR